MKKILLLFIIFFNLLYSAEVKELPWPRGETFLTFLDKYSISNSLYFNLEKEDKELCSEISADAKHYLYEEDDGSLNQVLIPVSEDIQLHIYKDIDNTYKFKTLPINYEEITQSIALPITTSIAYDLKKATGSPMLAAQLKSIYDNTVNFRRMQKGDFIVIKYKQKTLMGRAHSMPEILASMVEVSGRKHYRFKNSKDDKYYDEKAKAFTKTYFFKVPLTYKRISSHFTKKRWHPVLKRYRAHLGTDFAAPRGRKIYAAGDGYVEFIGRRGGYGKTIIINHRNGYKTLYAHQNAFRKGLKRRQSVRKGDHIGYVGNTGLSSGPHLHLGLYKNGRAVNAMNVIRKADTKALKGKSKRTFIANAKIMIKDIDLIIKDENREKPIKLDRTTYKTKLTI